MCEQREIDAGWLDDLVAGDSEAWHRAYEELTPRLLRIAIGVIGNEHDAQDAVQDTWSDCRRAIIGRRRDKLTAGYFTVAAWKSAVRVRKRNANRARHEKSSSQIARRSESASEFLDNFHESSAEEKTPVAHAIRNETNQLVKQAIPDLPSELQEVVRLKFDEGLTRQNISKELGLTIEQVRGRENSALNRLRVLLADKLE